MTSRYERIEFTDKQRLEIYHNAGGRCQGKNCGRKLPVKERWIADHILPVALGGKTVIENGQLLGECCNPGKTADDIRRMRKADRMGKKHLGLRARPRQIIPGSKASGWKHSMTHGWIRRET